MARLCSSCGLWPGRRKLVVERQQRGSLPNHYGFDVATFGVRAWFGGSGWSGASSWLSEPVEPKLKAFVQEARRYRPELNSHSPPASSFPPQPLRHSAHSPAPPHWPAEPTPSVLVPWLTVHGKTPSYRLHASAGEWRSGPVLIRRPARRLVAGIRLTLEPLSSPLWESIRKPQ
jgi:hypothetical protein